jgi:hypothetical protein
MDISNDLSNAQELKERMLASRQLLEDVKLALPGHRSLAPNPILPAPEKMRSRRKRHNVQDPDPNPAAGIPTPPPEPPQANTAAIPGSPFARKLTIETTGL